MRLRLLFTLGLVLCLSTIATSNECARYGHQAGGCKAACGKLPEGSGGNSSGESEVTTPAQPVNGEYSTLLVSKLLYI